VYSGRLRIVLFGLALLLANGSVALADSVRPVQGPLILAKSGDHAEFLWDATKYVTSLVSDNVLGDAGMHALEASAMSGLADKATTSQATTLTIAVSYKPVGANSIYGKPTFGAAQKLCTITVSKADVVKNGTAWAQSLADGKVPPGVELQATGSLPPPH
jgi:hypothetical protein